jgi:hydrogenase assembly chaperone HypC/HupF
MCLAIPGKIIKINKNKAVVKYPQETSEALIAGERVRVGDYVLVQMGIIIKILSREEAKEIINQ